MSVQIFDLSSEDDDSWLAAGWPKSQDFDANYVSCHRGDIGLQPSAKRQHDAKQQQINLATHQLREAYAAFDRGDIDAAVQLLDPQVEWTEPAEFPGGGTYHGVEGAKHYLMQSRAAVAQVISEPERISTYSSPATSIPIWPPRPILVRLFRNYRVATLVGVAA